MLKIVSEVKGSRRMLLRDRMVLGFIYQFKNNGNGQSVSNISNKTGLNFRTVRASLNKLLMLRECEKINDKWRAVRTEETCVRWATGKKGIEHFCYVRHERIPGLKISQSAVYAYCLSFARKSKHGEGHFRCPINSLVAACNISKATTRRYLERFVSLGLLEPLERKGWYKILGGKVEPVKAVSKPKISNWHYKTSKPDGEYPSCIFDDEKRCGWFDNLLDHGCEEKYALALASGAGKQNGSNWWDYDLPDMFIQKAKEITDYNIKVKKMSLDSNKWGKLVPDLLEQWLNGKIIGTKTIPEETEDCFA